MAVDRSGSAFARSFMQGFSFIDNAFAQRREEKRLDERLRMLKEDQQFNRKMATERNERARAVESRAQATFDDAQADERMMEEGEALFASGKFTDEDVARYAPFSPSFQAEAAKRARQGEIRSSVQSLQGLSAGAQGVTGQGGQTQTGTAPGEEPLSAPEAAAEQAAEQGQALFAPSRGTDALEQVSEEDITTFDPEFQEKGLAARAGDVVAGQFQQLTRGVGNIAESGARARDVAGIIPGPRAAGAAFAGDTFVDEDFVTVEEFNQITDPEEREAVRARNAEIIEAQKKAARDPSRNKLARPITRQGAVQEGGELARDAALRAENAVLQRYEKFLSDESDPLEEMAAADPGAAATRYFEDRATLKSANPDVVAAVDKRMAPVLRNYATQIQNDLATMPPGTADYRKTQQRLANVVTSANQIAGDQPSVNSQAGVRGGLPVGNAALSGQVVDVAFDPNRPSPVAGTMPTSRANAAMTVAGRITPNTRRLTDKQVDSLVTLVDYGLVDKQTFQTVLATGAWPPGKDPNSIKSLMKGGDGYLYGLTEDGNVQVIPLQGKKGPGTPGAIPNQELDGDKLAKIVEGAALQLGGMQNMTPETASAVSSLALNNSGYIRNTFAVTSEEQLMKLGSLIQQSHFLAQWNKNENYGGFWEPDAKNAPTGRDVMMNPAMRRAIAQDYAESEGRRIQLVDVPSRITEADDIDWEEARQSIRNGDLAEYGITPEYADSMTNNDLAYVIYVLNASPEQIEADAAEARQ